MPRMPEAGTELSTIVDLQGGLGHEAHYFGRDAFSQMVKSFSARAQQDQKFADVLPKFVEYAHSDKSDVFDELKYGSQDTPQQLSERLLGTWVSLAAEKSILDVKTMPNEADGARWNQLDGEVERLENAILLAHKGKKAVQLDETVVNIIADPTGDRIENLKNGVTEVVSALEMIPHKTAIKVTVLTLAGEMILANCRGVVVPFPDTATPPPPKGEVKPAYPGQITLAEVKNTLSSTWAKFSNVSGDEFVVTTNSAMCDDNNPNGINTPTMFLPNPDGTVNHNVGYVICQAPIQMNDIPFGEARFIIIYDGVHKATTSFLLSPEKSVVKGVGPWDILTLNSLGQLAPHGPERQILYDGINFYVLSDTGGKQELQGNNLSVSQAVFEKTPGAPEFNVTPTAAPATATELPTLLPITTIQETLVPTLVPTPRPTDTLAPTPDISRFIETPASDKQFPQGEKSDMDLIDAALHASGRKSLLDPSVEPVSVGQLMTESNGNQYIHIICNADGVSNCLPAAYLQFPDEINGQPRNPSVIWWEIMTKGGPAILKAEVGESAEDPYANINYLLAHLKDYLDIKVNVATPSEKNMRPYLFTLTQYPGLADDLTAFRNTGIFAARLQEELLATVEY